MSKKYNILLIMGDQHRSDCIGANGNVEIKTENLDQLVEDGVGYTNSFCTAPVCTPSRYSILTGMHPHQHQGYTNSSSIPYTNLAFPNILKENGYKTEVIGKMHTNPTRLDVGYGKVLLAEQTEPGRYEDDYHDYLDKKGLTDVVDTYDQVLSAREDAPEEYWKTFGAMESNLREEDYSTSWIGEHAIEALKKWDGDNNLLTVSFVKPHHPFDPPTPWSKMYNSDELTILPGWTESVLERNEKVHSGYFPNENLTKDTLKQIMAYYYASISHIDYYIGRFMDILKEKGLYEDTIIIYTSDHGEYLGFQHMLLKSNNMYDPIAKVPLIVKYPSNIVKPAVVDNLVYNIDIGPTLFDLLDIEKSKFLSGKSLLSTSEIREYVVTEDGRGNAYMIRSKRYKLFVRKTEELNLFFDLEVDPLEMNNLYNDENYQSIINEFKLKLGHFMLFESPTPIYKVKQNGGV